MTRQSCEPITSHEDMTMTFFSLSHHRAASVLYGNSLKLDQEYENYNWRTTCCQQLNEAQ